MLGSVSLGAALCPLQAHSTPAAREHLMLVLCLKVKGGEKLVGSGLGFSRPKPIFKENYLVTYLKIQSCIFWNVAGESAVVHSTQRSDLLGLWISERTGEKQSWLLGSLRLLRHSSFCWSKQGLVENC